jgi:hypothetical protein
MLDVSEQGFYELILRSVLAELEQSGASADLLDRVRQAYQGIVTPASPFVVALSFIEGMITLAKNLKRRLVLLCDEFDEPFAALDGRVFLNLRALKDRYPQDICYITATGRRLSEIRQDHGASEFAELSEHNVHFLRPLGRSRALELAAGIAAEYDAVLPAPDLDFIWDQAGGHPGLLEAVCGVRIQACRAGLDDLTDARQHARVRQLLDNDLNVRTECAKLWNDLSAAEQQTLMRFLASGSTS